jgi:hypothetical protein
MKERGVIIPIGDGCELMFLPNWRCLVGHRWHYSDKNTRACERCGKHMVYQIVDSGRSKAWCWASLPEYRAR